MGEEIPEGVSEGFSLRVIPESELSEDGSDDTFSVFSVAL
jgi:hypothetical protein